MPVRDTDKGYKALLASLKDCTGSNQLEIVVGIQAEEGGASGDGGLSVVEIAEINEYGLGVPARPAIGNWADKKAPEASNQMSLVIQAAIKAKQNPAQRLDALAQRWAGELQGAIAGGTPPPNAPSTIAKKGSSTPLIDEGQFRTSIRGRVRKAGS